MAAVAKKARVLRTPAAAADELVEQQRRKARELEEERRRYEAAVAEERRRHQAALEAALDEERRRHEARAKELRAEASELKRREADARARASVAPVTIGDLPEPALRIILLGPSDNLLRFVAACARVCAEWRRVVGGSAAYGLGLPRGRREDLPMHLQYNDEDGERARVLKEITRALETVGEELDLDDDRIGDAGAAVLGAALQAVPRIRFTKLDLQTSDLTAAGAVSLAPALRPPGATAG